MKATLEFDLPEEREEFDMASHAADYYSALCDIDNHLRSIVKYGDGPDEVIRLAEYIRRELMPDLYS